MLQALVSYTEQHLPESEPGFKVREVNWLIELTSDGRMLGIVPLGDGKRGQPLARCPDMHGMNAGGKSHFLIESAQTVALFFKKGVDERNAGSAEARHAFYVDLIQEASQRVSTLQPILAVLRDPLRLERLRLALSEHGAKPVDWVTWRVDGSDLREKQAVQSWWREWRARDLAKTGNTRSQRKGAEPMICLLSGERTSPLATHPKITGLAGVGGQPAGDVLVGFDKSSFASYGLNQSANAAMNADVVQKYVDGLNDLIRNHSRKLANAVVVHWFKVQVPPEDDPLAFLHGLEIPTQAEAAALGAAKRLLDAIRSGRRPDLGDNYYYALTLSGVAGRVMVRDWMEGRFEDLVANIDSWFRDFSIVARNGIGYAYDPKFMAVCGALVRDLKDLPAPTAATLWKAAVQCLPIPQPLVAQALARFRSDLVRDEPFNHARIGLIKAYFVRGGDSHMTAYLNADHPSPAYHCGRLLALFANLQRAALGDVGAGVVQRYYAAFSQTPGLVLGRLVNNARNHLGKLDAGLAWWYESQVADVMNRLKDTAPRILDLEGQGLFALGYYQQLAALRSGKKNIKSNSASEQGEDK